VPGSESRRTPVATASGRSEGSVSGSGSLTLIPEIRSGPSEQIREISERYGPGFLEFWAAYPLKVGKAEAARSWKRKKPPLAKCLEALAWQKKTPKWAKDKIIPNPATWVNQGRWEDEPPASAAIQRAREYFEPSPWRPSEAWGDPKAKEG
jgi:hypothetical protein